MVPSDWVSTTGGPSFSIVILYVIASLRLSGFASLGAGADFAAITSRANSAIAASGSDFASTTMGGRRRFIPAASPPPVAKLTFIANLPIDR
jgi:hypothetical protein